MIRRKSLLAALHFRSRLVIERLESRYVLAGFDGLSLASDHGANVTTGTQVNWTAEIDQPTGLEFSFRKRGSASEWTEVRGYSDSLHWSWDTTNEASDRFFVTVFVRMQGSSDLYQAAATPISIIVSPVPPLTDLAVNSVHGAVLSRGKDATFRASSTHDLSPYEFKFTLRHEAEDWVTVRDFQPSHEWRWNNSATRTGFYYVTVSARARGSVSTGDTTAVPLTVELREPLVIGSAVVASDLSTLTIGQSASLEMRVTQVNEPIEVAFRMRRSDTDWVTARGYNQDTLWQMDSSGMSAGIYYVGASIRRVGSLLGAELHATPMTIVISASPPVSQVTLAVSQALRVTPGTVMQWTATGIGAGPIEYAFTRRSESGDWQVVREYSLNNQWQWNTSGLENEVFYVTVMARTVGSPVQYEAVATPKTVVVANVAAATDVVFSMDWSIPARVSEPFAVSAWGLGGSGDFEYRFRFRGEEDWQLERTHTTENIWEWTPSSEQLGTQYIEVCARSVGSPLACEATRVVRVDVRESAEQLWDRVYADYLSEPLWHETYVEDASHTLHLPLSAAFQETEQEIDRSSWRRAYSDQFARFVASNETIDVQLYRVEYYYLASRFVRLAMEAGQPELIPIGLVEKLYDEVQSLWMEEPAWMWDSPSFPGGMRERIAWKLNVESVPYRYYAAMVDHDLFLFGIAAELRSYLRLAGLAAEPVLDEIAQVTRQVLEDRIQWNSHGGWLFQQSMWSDHPEYAHSGHAVVAPNLDPLPVDDLAEDSSHSMRWPLWLKSFESGAEPGSNAAAYYHFLRVGLNEQFTKRVLVRPTNAFDGYRITNYMNGYNGIYRYQYYTAGEGRGFNAYELSGALMIGIWGHLESAEVREAYRHLASRFPMDAGTLPTYIGANTQRVRHPLETWPAAFSNGNYEFHALLASQLPITI